MFRILSIDGGGIKGVFPAAFLAELEKLTRGPIHRYFDLIAGTSTGGIIALGLGLGLSAGEITEFYRKHGPEIFSNPRSYLKRLTRAKYSPKSLHNALYEVFGDSVLGNSKVRLIIPSFNATSGEIHIYKTRHHPRFHMDHVVSMLDVALATTAAPTFFPAHRGAGGALYVDGGLWANNPTGNAVVEAITWTGQKPTDLEVLSIGCTQFPSPRDNREGLNGAPSLVESALKAQSGGSLGVAYSLMGGHEHVKRINPMTVPGQFSLDGVGAIDQLAAFAYSEARKASSELYELFFRQAAPPFTPIPCE